MSVLHLDDLLLGRGDVLIATDVQNDFLPSGALPAPEGDRVIPPLNRAIRRFRAAGLPIVATRDWHPPDHISFRSRGGPWPPHCVQGTWGARFAEGLELPPDAIVISKATHPDQEAYSAFRGTDLDQRLRELGAQHLFVGGLTTEYCVSETVQDALERGYAVSILVDAVSGVEAQPGDSERALRRLLSLGATPVSAGEHGREHPAPMG